MKGVSFECINATFSAGFDLEGLSQDDSIFRIMLTRLQSPVASTLLPAVKYECIDLRFNEKLSVHDYFPECVDVARNVAAFGRGICRELPQIWTQIDRKVHLLSEPVAADSSLSKGLLSEARGSKSELYVVATGQAMKIGYARNVSRRISALQIGCPEQLFLLGRAPGNKEAESYLHGLCSKYHLRGEWYARTKESEAIVRSALQHFAL